MKFPETGTCFDPYKWYNEKNWGEVSNLTGSPHLGGKGLWVWELIPSWALSPVGIKSLSDGGRRTANTLVPLPAGGKKHISDNYPLLIISDGKQRFC